MSNNTCKIIRFGCVMFTSISHSLCLVPVLSVVCWRAHVLFTLIVCVCVHSGVQHTLCCALALFYFVLLYQRVIAIRKSKKDR
jgi:hypothetical protein